MLDTVWPADSVEFCPDIGKAHIFACGTYHLQPRAEEELKSQQKRLGKILLLNVHDDGTITQTQEIELAAVPDLKWRPMGADKQSFLSAADSEGAVNFLSLDLQTNSLSTVQRVPVAPEDTLCLSLDWSKGQSQPRLVASFSNGDLALLEHTSSGLLEVQQNWKAHDHEPWIAAFDHHDQNVIYSGGDDLCFKSWDIRSGFSSPVSLKRRFEAGITSIQSSPHDDRILAVGRLYDKRNIQRSLSETDLEGGIWRIKWHHDPARSKDLVTACMHNGFRVVHFEDIGGSKPGDIVRRFDEHSSLAYGVDWSHAPPQGGESLIASCSFYDHTLHTWRG